MAWSVGSKIRKGDPAVGRAAAKVVELVVAMADDPDPAPDRTDAAAAP